MRKFSLVCVSSILTCVCVPSLAQVGPPSGCDGVTGNCSIVDQTSSDNDALVGQSGSENEAYVEQSSKGGGETAEGTQDGIGNILTISQIGSVGGNVATSRQFGNDGEATITQGGASNGAIADILQGALAEKNVATIEQLGTTGNEALIGQDNGIANSALIRQSDDENRAEIIQSGSDNEANTTQSGTAFFAGHAEAFVTQTGNDNISTVEQSTDGGQFIEVVQTGDFNVSTVFQGRSGISSGNEVNLIQIGNGNTSLIDQGFNSDNNLADVLQEGNGNSSTISQNSFLGAALANRIDLDQVGDASISTITQGGGQDNFARVGQYGYAQVSSVSQTGNGNIASVMQGVMPTP